MSYTIINREAGKLTINDDSGAPKDITQLVLNDDLGNPKRVNRLWINDAGIWRSIAWRNPNVLMTITADEGDLDVYQALVDDAEVDETLPISLRLVVNSDATVYSTLADHPALRFSSALVSGSDIVIENRGHIVGAGGQGRGGISSSTNVISDIEISHGGAAISISNDVLIDNTLGHIYGGGGGGGCFMSDRGSLTLIGAGGGAQGQQGGPRGVRAYRGYTGWPVIEAEDGDFDGPGDGSTPVNQPTNTYGGTGGEWGQAGDVAVINWAAIDPILRPFWSLHDPGDGGEAVLLNGNTVTWINEGDVKP